MKRSPASDALPASPESSWVPSSCTLPTVDQPIRVSEFDDLFARSLVAVDATSRTSAQLSLLPDAEVDARQLADRESSCCSFFTFAFEVDHSAAEDGTLAMVVRVPDTQAPVLAAFVRRARTAAELDAPVDPPRR